MPITPITPVKRPSSTTFLAQIVTAVLAALIALAGSDLWWAYKEALHLAESKLQEEARVHGERIDAVLTLVDFSLRELAVDLQGGDGRALADRPAAAARVRRHTAFTRAVFVGVYGADGTLLVSAGRAPGRLDRLGGLDAFRRHRDRTLPFQIETSAQLGLGRRPVIGLSRPLTDAGGRFTGIVLALVDVQSPGGAESDGTMHIAEGKALLDTSGEALAVWGTAPDTATFAHPAGTEWIAEVHQLSGFPLRLGAAVRRDQAMEGWLTEVQGLLVMLGTSMTLLIALIVVLAAQWKRRQRAEMDLYDQFAFQKTLVDTIPIPIYYKGTDLRYLGCNAAFAAAVGRRPEDVVGLSMADFFGRDEAGHHETLDRALLVRGAPVTDECTLRLPDGGARSLLVSKARFNHADGSPGGIVGAFLDITERRQAEERMAILLKALDHSPAIILITDARGVITYVNQAFSKVTGYAPGEVIGRTPCILKSGETPPAVYRDLWATIAEGRIWHGEFRNRRKNGDAYWDRTSIAPILNQEGATISYVAIKEDITAEKEASERIWERANFDDLTGLVNRTMLRDRLVGAIDGARTSIGRVALLYIDLDRFKPVNDTYGHEVGDELLKQVAQRLRQSVRDSDTVSRLGGDEFVVLTGIGQDAEAEAIGRRILASLSEPFALSAATVTVGASIGIAVFPRDAANAEELLKRADVAMYAAKQAGRDTMRFFDPGEMRESSVVES